MGSFKNRDSGGRFFPAGRMDARQKVMHRLNEEENKLVKIYTKLCKLTGSPVTAKFLEIKQYPESGNWRIGSWVGTFFSGFLAGIIFAVKKKNNVFSAVALLEEARTIRKKIYQLKKGNIRLVKKGY
jgi:hypothetical protein